MPSHVDPAIYVAANIGDKRVVARAMAALRISQARAVGHLVMFWGRVAMHVPDGRLGEFTDAQLESWAGWDGKRGAWAAWLRAEHLDPEQRPTDWEDYAGRLALARQRAREKKVKQRNDLRDSVPGTGAGQEGGQSRPCPGDPLRARAHTLEKVQSTEREELLTTSAATTAREAFLSAVPGDRRPGWVATLAGWAEGMGAPGGKALAPEHIDAGLAEYLANEQAPTFAPRHVVRYVEAAASRPARPPEEPGTSGMGAARPRPRPGGSFLDLTTEERAC